MEPKAKMGSAVENWLPELWEISRQMYEHPELGLAERRSARMLADWLEGQGFAVERGFHGMPTAFRAVYGGGRPVVGFLCEYDALPEVGHGCGHNLIGVISAGAAAALKTVLDGPGTIVVYGTPDEEDSCAKVQLLEEGAFDEADVALMLHPYRHTCSRVGSVGIRPIQFEFFGKKCHANEAGPQCVNALDAAVMSYVNINQIKQYLDANIYGIVKNGGVRPNIIPDYACLQYFIRCDAQWKTELAVQRVTRCVQGVADSMGVRLETSQYLAANTTLLYNETLLETFEKNLARLGEPVLCEAGDRVSTDAANVSFRVPTLHGMIGIAGCEHVDLHTQAFADATVSPAGRAATRTGILALAGTAYDVWSSPECLGQVRRDFTQALEDERRKEELYGANEVSGR